MISRLACQEIDPESISYWDNMRNHDYSASFPAVKNFIHQNLPKRESPKRKRNRIIWVLTVLLPLLVFFSCRRATYINPQGATLSFTAKDSLLNRIDYILQPYIDKEWKAVFWPRGGTMRGVISTSAEQYNKLKEVAEKLKEISGITELYLSAMNTSIKEPPLSRLTYKFFNWHFNSIDASDKQLRIAIASRLKEAGQYDLQLQLVQENGRKQVDIIPNNKTRNFSIAFTLLDGSNIIAIAEKW